jgi:glycosyltransferase involved in cell wall biosynthesis
MQITVIVPTFYRPKDLEKCLEAFKHQTRTANELFVIVRDTDVETKAFLEEFNSELLPLKPLMVSIPGVVAAMNRGLEAASGDIIAFTDDDAAPHNDWLEKIEAHFLSDVRIGGVGGRDWVYFGTQLYDGAPQTERIGRIQWFGRVIGNHHLGIGRSQEVDILKGVNMSFRKASLSGLRFDERMRGTGAQVHFEMGFCLALKRSGWKLIYDPAVAVDHFRGERFDEDQRDQFSSLAAINMVHNETLTLLEYLPPLQRFLFILWTILIGIREARGLLQGWRLPSKGKLAKQKLLAYFLGRWKGWQTWQMKESEEFNR